MPRKQRFKPSRKPKPSPQSEASAIGQDPRNAAAHNPGAHNDNVDAAGSPTRMRDDVLPRDPEIDSR